MFAQAPAVSECTQMLALLDRFRSVPCVRDVLCDAEEIQRLLALYSFRSPHQADRLAGELSSRYRADILALYGSAGASRRQSENCYLRLEQLSGILVRVAVMRLMQAGMLKLSRSQLMLGDGMLLGVLEKACDSMEP